MFRTRTAVLSRTCLLIALSLPFGGVADAASEKEFAKCQKMLGKFASWHQQKADKATHAYDRKVIALISGQAAGQPEAELEEARLEAIIDKLVARYELDYYRRTLVDDAVQAVENAQNSENFSCPEKWAFRHGLNSYLERYKNRLEEVEDAVRDRLDIENLGPDEGLAVISFFAHGHAGNININRLGAIGGNIDFGPIVDDEYFRVIRVQAGNYRWHSIWKRTWDGKTTLHLKRSKFDFSIEAGKLNYTGLFIYRAPWIKGPHANVYDRTAVVITLLEQRYPELLDKFELTNGLDLDNRFIEFYQRAKEAAEVEDDSA